MTLRKRKDTEKRKRKQWLALSGELVLEEGVDLSEDRTRDGDDDYDDDDDDDDDDTVHII